MLSESLMARLSLILLVLQTVGVVFAIRTSRIQSGPRYLNSTAVCCTEVLKVILSALFLLRGSDSKQRADGVVMRCLCDWPQLLRVAIPCVLYTVQNNLLFLALSNLSGAEYQVTYQLKILSTALLSVMILGKRLSALKWVSLLVLTVGVVLIQRKDDAANAVVVGQRRALGIFAVLMACMTSGLAGVYMERLMKKTTSMWATNLQVAAISSVVALVGAFVQDGEAITRDGFFFGYSRHVCVVIVLQAVGGFIIAGVMKYADNLLKCFGNALSITISCIVSALWLGEFTPDRWFFVGTFLVLVAVALYAAPEKSSGSRAGANVPASATAEPSSAEGVSAESDAQKKRR
eukprot:TRINITY_DN17099_c0_g4_i1.p1 TRINITY_DN17099_c0_g4~~TRINITY_DN17099_c0_g4_i1.p1  ORF type:complete len:348 (+),score=46.82 TRINITY_DN17099_c0_g4_i1:153-1196(+)